MKNFDTSRLQMSITRIIDKQMGFLVDHVDIAWEKRTDSHKIQKQIHYIKAFTLGEKILFSKITVSILSITSILRQNSMLNDTK